MKPIPNQRSEFHGRDVPTEIRNFYNVNEVNTFQFDRPYHREEKDPDNESKVCQCMVTHENIDAKVEIIITSLMDLSLSYHYKTNIQGGYAGISPSGCPVSVCMSV